MSTTIVPESELILAPNNWVRITVGNRSFRIKHARDGAAQLTVYRVDDEDGDSIVDVSFSAILD